jgi:hypothetical protein
MKRGTSISRSRAGRALNALLLWCALGGLAAGTLGGYLGLRLFRPGAVEAAAGPAAKSTASAIPESAAGPGETSAAPVAGEVAAEENVVTALRAASARMTSEQRLAEIDSLLKHYQSTNSNEVFQNWPEIFTSFLGLMQPEDLEKLREKALAPSAAGRGMPDMGYIAFQAAFITNWADWDEGQVETWLTGFKEPTGGFMIPVSLYALGSKWARADPFQAWDRMMGLRGRMKDIPQQADAGFYPISMEAARTNPRLTLEKALTLKSPDERDNVAGMAIGSLAKTDFAAAMKLSEVEGEPGLSQRLKSNAINGYIYSVGLQDPKGYTRVADFLMSEEGDSVRDTGLSTLLHRWNTQDPEAARAWLKANPETDQMYDLSTNLDRRELSKKPTSDLMAEADAMPAGKERDATLRAAYRKAINKDPEAALGYLASQGKPENETALIETLQTYSQNDPVLLASKYGGFSPKVQEKVAARLMDSWMRVDSPAAFSWLEKQPAGAGKDAGLSRAIEKHAKEDPSAAAAWALQASTEEKQDKMLKTVAGNWRGKDIENARRWAWQQGTLSTASRDKFLKALEGK